IRDIAIKRRGGRGQDMAEFFKVFSDGHRCFPIRFLIFALFYAIFALMSLFQSLAGLLGALSPVHIRFVTLLIGATPVGMDQLGNKYYRARPRKGYKRERRWVIYKDAPEASLVPPEWHGWLHHQTDIVPNEATRSFRRPWQRPHQPNLTGTDQAYRPPGHLLKGGHRAASDSDYQAWRPD